MNGAGHYIHWGFFQMSVANFVVIAGMVGVFIAAVLAPFPGKKKRRP